MLIWDLRQLPRGSHCLSLHASEGEAARHAVTFLSGEPDEERARYFVHDERLRPLYDGWFRAEAPTHSGCVSVLDREQVEADGSGRLRPIEEVRRFLESHPGGVSAGGDTLSHHWRPENLPEHLEYEAWFNQQPREHSRFVCPYDLRRVPADSAPHVLRELGSLHSHVALSRSEEPAARLLQLFVFGTRETLPEELDADLGWALRKNLVRFQLESGELELTPVGDMLVREWGRRTIIDW